MEQDLNQWYQLLTLGSWTCHHWHGEARTLFKKKKLHLISGLLPYSSFFKFPRKHVIISELLFILVTIDHFQAHPSSSTVSVHHYPNQALTLIQHTKM